MGTELNVNTSETIFAIGSRTTVVGTASIDLLKGTSLNDTISAGAGNDRVWGGLGDDTIYGDEGDDILYGDDGDDKIYGGTGNDSVFGGAGEDTIYGEADNDFLRGGADNDKIFGGAGNDVLRGDEGDDILEGGDGADQFRYSMAALSVDQNFGAMFGNDTIKDFQQGVDKIDLRDFFARMTDDEVDAFLDSLDTVGETKKGADKYEYYDNASSTYMAGNESEASDTRQQQDWSLNVSSTKHGNEKAGYEYTTTLHLTNHSNDEDKGASITVKGVRELHADDFLRENAKLGFGTEGNDTRSLDDITHDKSVIYHGLGGNDTITGTDNSDQIWGDDGNDTIKGGDGEDQLWGGAGSDNLFGESGHDVIYGGTGDDRMWGGSGNDIFVIGGKVTQGGQFDFDQGQDTIEDFELANSNGVGGDRIRFADIFSSGNLGQSNTNKAGFTSDWFEKHVEKGAHAVIIHEKESVGGRWDATDDHVTIKSASSVDDVYKALHDDPIHYFTFG